MSLRHSGVAAIIIIVLIIIVIITIIAKSSANENDGKNIEGDNIMVLIAHPDDEAMFFTPTLVQMKKLGKKLHVICLSNGNYEGLGHKRENELYLSLSKFNITRDNICIGSFTDGPDQDWNTEDIANIIDKYVKKWNIDTIITFDDMGVSGHPNHIACFNATQYYLRDLSPLVNGVALKSVGGIEKFIGPLSLLGSKGSNSCTLSGYRKAWNQMADHSSQFTWYRKLFIIFSQYSYVNKLDNVRT